MSSSRPPRGVYRNGDAVSASLVFGERMVIGTHNGNIHILSLPSLNSIRVYHAHSASITSISVSPPPPPPLPAQIRRFAAHQDRNIHVATSAIDGLVCIVPLLPANPGNNSSAAPYSKSEITFKNFKRPIQSVALSPNFRTDRTFISGGLAGNLILSVAPPAGGGGGMAWMGLGGGSGKDTVLHSGEGAISAISWSKESPRFVAWTNEQGIKIMRSHIVPPEIKKEEIAWKRISAIERPESIPEELAAVHKPRLEWIDRRNLSEDDVDGRTLSTADDISPTAVKGKPSIGTDWGQREKLLVGWGGTIWVMDVFAGDGTGEEEKRAGWAEIVHILQTDCTISGLTLYSPSLVLLLAYLKEEKPSSPEPGQASSSAGAGASPSSGSRTRRGRTNALTPELRFIDLNTSEEVSADELLMSRFEGLAVGDYHLGVLPTNPPMTTRPPSASGEGDILGIGTASNYLWAAGMNATQIFSSAASVRSLGSVSRRESFSNASASKASGSLSGLRGMKEKKEDVGWEEYPGKKIYITSPYDVVFATERSPKDHLGWLLEKEKYKDAWELVDAQPDIISSDTASLSEYDEIERIVVDADASDPAYDSDSTISGGRHKVVQMSSAAEKEKRRIGELWLRSLIDVGDWTTAGAVCRKVLGVSGRWEHWVWVFEAAGKIEEITPYIPSTPLSPPLPSVIYEIVLAHYLTHDRRRFQKLLVHDWRPEGSRSLYDPRTIINAVERKLDNREDDVYEGDEDWIILQECLAKLFMAVAEPRNALKFYVILKNADEAFKLIREFRLVDAVKDDILSFIKLRVSDEQMQNASIAELEGGTEEAIGLLVQEAGHGIVGPKMVVRQLDDDKVAGGKLFLFFYLRRLWIGSAGDSSGMGGEGIGIGGGGILAEFGDLMVELFAEYDRPLLMDFLKDSHSYSLEKASAVCERRNYIPELVHLLSKTGQTKRALFLIIDKLADVSQAIAFAKTQDDPDLWNDLLDYSMDKPKFIRGLLENVGTTIDPITLVRRIPTGLEIEGLKAALGKILKEYGVQWSICDGVAKVLRSEVARGMEELRKGQRRGVKFEVAIERELHLSTEVEGPATEVGGTVRDVELEREEIGLGVGGRYACGVCKVDFEPTEKDTLIAFACRHIFHVRCLVIAHGSEADVPEVCGHGAEEEILGVMGRSVGTKVTHAALIRHRVQGGCVLCERKGGEDEFGLF
ncbi:unnamed protein product [Tuber melanosporum]|uniref:(Perigord truffle) hypothetical protein n=1 Tax=Tuber melanosporum (strain Mel28) TaxID=656061 RepID=D5GHM2_TUBMM|nr:uncharacterized protein GSTUM_00008038001 [Tuber melanosporum]CAZ84052.1 unnamed protein product [Tuber melanosporum]